MAVLNNQCQQNEEGEAGVRRNEKSLRQKHMNVLLIK